MAGPHRQTVSGAYPRCARRAQGGCSTGVRTMTCTVWAALGLPRLAPLRPAAAGACWRGPPRPDRFTGERTGATVVSTKAADTRPIGKPACGLAVTSVSYIGAPRVPMGPCGFCIRCGLCARLLPMCVATTLLYALDAFHTLDDRLMQRCGAAMLQRSSHRAIVHMAPALISIAASVKVNMLG